MLLAKAGPNEYLLVGRGGRLENRGSAVQAFVPPGAVHVLVPSTKEEAAFEFTQETRDGIPLRFKGIIIYRVTDPVAAAAVFDFDDDGLERITTLLTHVCLGELRHAVSHMTMIECIEQRKTTLSGVAASALEATVRGRDGLGDWGLSIEVAQVSQVFIVDGQLRQQLEAEVRNEIRLRSDQSGIRAQEETRLSEMASESRVAEQKLATDRESLRREEELELAKVARERRMEAERIATARETLRLEQERFRAEMDAERDRVESEAPVRLFRIARERDVLHEEVDMRELQNRVQALAVEHDLLLRRAEQELRREILPIEQAPEIVDSVSKILRRSNLTIYGEDGRLLGELAPMFELLAHAVQDALRRTAPAP